MISFFQICFQKEHFPVSTSASVTAGTLGGGENAEGLCCF